MEDCSFTIFALVATAREAIVIALWAGGIAGLGYLATAVFAAWRFGRRVGPQPSVRPPVSILKPLCGDEPELYENLRSFCVQVYPTVQVIFGLRDADDPARAAVERLIADLPEADLVLVVDDRLHGTNYKISNLINMMAAARHDLLVLADSDMRVATDYLDRIVAPLAECGCRPRHLPLCGRAGAPRPVVESRHPLHQPRLSAVGTGGTADRRAPGLLRCERRPAPFGARADWRLPGIA